MQYAADSAAELDRYQHREERLAELQERDEELRRQIGELAGRLSQIRGAAAVRLRTGENLGPVPLPEVKERLLERVRSKSLEL